MTGKRRKSAAFARILRIVCVTVGCVLLAAAPASTHAQSTHERKLLVRVQPNYPEFLKDHDIGGTVRLSVEVAPNGSVRKVTPLGGNPILVESAVAAVKQWKYVAAEATEKFDVRVDFSPSLNK